MSTIKTSATSKVESKNATAKNPVQVQKSATKVDDILNPSASGRIRKLENFQILAKKHEFLQEKRNSLDRFIISSDGTKEKVILKNSEGYIFEVSNSQVLEEVLGVLQRNLETFISKSEKEVLAFEI